MKPLTILATLVAAFLSLSAISSMAADKPFPDHWGDPPKIQTRDLRELPGGFGKGSSTLAAWIQKNLDADAEKKDASDGDTGKGGGEWMALWNGKNPAPSKQPN